MNVKWFKKHIDANVADDISNGLPFMDNSVVNISLPDLGADPEMLLSELMRVLRPGGTATIVTSDFDKFAELFAPYISDHGQIEGSDSHYIQITKPEEVVKAEVTTKRWDGDKSRFTIEQLSNAVPKAILAWAKKQGDLIKENLRLPYKEPDGTINLNGVRNALARLPQIKGIPKSVLDEAKKELQAVLEKYRKSEDSVNTDVEFLFKKGETDPHTFYFVVHEPWKVDADGHYFTPEAIMKGCHDFSQSVSFDQRHDGVELDGIKLVENYIAPETIEFQRPDGVVRQVKKGGWVIGVNADDNPEIKAKILSGEYKGVSMEGLGLFIEGKEDEIWLS